MATQNPTHHLDSHFDDEGPVIRPGEGFWVCAECPFFSSSFEGLERHVFEKHLGAENS